MSTMDEAASTTDTWALLILTLPLEPSPWWTRAPVPLLLLLLLVWRLCRFLIEKGLGPAEALVFGGESE